MDSCFDHREQLPAITIRPLPYLPRSLSKVIDHREIRISPSAHSILHRPKQRQCYDWIFSSSTNVHIAIDRAAFKTYTPFESYVLTLSDQQRVQVEGIGTVEIKVRCRPGSKGDRAITLDKVLYIPSWYCNIFSDIYFNTIPDFQYTWTDFGINFVIKEKGKMKSFAYTDNFCGLDRIVMSRKHGGRSPMLEDKEREVFSVNVTWPQSQQDAWQTFQARKISKQAAPIPSFVHLTRTESRISLGKPDQTLSSPRSNSRIRLGEINNAVKVVQRSPGKRKSSLRATVSSIALNQMSESKWKNT